MTLEEAIKTALEYEVRIRDLYIEAAAGTKELAGKKIFQDLADDEQNHVRYLESKLERWQRDGSLDVDRLDSIIPPAKLIQAEAAKLEKKVRRDDRGLKEQMLSKALQMEIETSRFYQEMVDQMGGDSQKMFARFLEIEDNHIQAVQFELDHVSHMGFWFGFEEFDMEVG